MLRWEQSWSTRTMRSLEQPVRHTWGKQKHMLEKAAGELPGGLKTTLTKMKENKTPSFSTNMSLKAVLHCTTLQQHRNWVKAAVRRSTLFARDACKSGYSWCFCLLFHNIKGGFHPRCTALSDRLLRATRWLRHERPLCVTKTHTEAFSVSNSLSLCAVMDVLLPIRYSLLIHSEVCSSHIFFKLWKWTCIAFHLLLFLQHPAVLILCWYSTYFHYY